MLYTTRSSEDERQYWRRSVEGGESRRVADLMVIGTWSRGGQWFLTTRTKSTDTTALSNGISREEILLTNGTVERVVAHTQRGITSACLSPDGTRVLYSTDGRRSLPSSGDQATTDLNTLFESLRLDKEVTEVKIVEVGREELSVTSLPIHQWDLGGIGTEWEPCWVSRRQQTSHGRAPMG